MEAANFLWIWVNINLSRQHDDEPNSALILCRKYNNHSCLKQGLETYSLWVGFGLFLTHRARTAATFGSGGIYGAGYYAVACGAWGDISSNQIVGTGLS